MPILIPILFFIVAMLAASDMGTTAGTAASPLSDQVEKWRPMVTQYCTKYKIPGYVDLALALMQVESSGNEPDPMQAAEGAYNLELLLLYDRDQLDLQHPLFLKHLLIPALLH